MDVHTGLAELRRALEEARSMPMSASAVVNRGEVLALVDRVSAALDEALAESARLVAERDAVLDLGREQAAQIVAEAHRERERVVADSGLHEEAQREADRLLEQARSEATQVRREADDYVDAKLAHFEITLERTSEAVRQGRERLSGTASVFGGITSDEVDKISLPAHLDG